MKAKARAIIADPWEHLQRLESLKLARQGWNHETVQDHMVGAFQILRRLPEGQKHKAVRTVWPDDVFAKDQDALVTERFATEVHAIALGDEETIQRVREKNRVIVPPRAEEITRMMKALAWPATYIENNAIRAVLVQCSHRMACRGSIRKLCRERGWPYSTTFARLEAACRTIAEGLIRDGIPTWDAADQDDQ